MVIDVQRVGGMRKSMLRRMNVRLDELGWQGSELLDLYCRARTQVEACDAYFQKQPVIDVEGKVAQASRFYLNAILTSIRALEALRQVVSEIAKEDDRLDGALEALAAEGQKARLAKAAAGG